MASYEDMTGDADGIMYMKKYNDSGALNAWKLYNFSFKAAPKAGVNVSHSMNQGVKLDKDDAQPDAWKSTSTVDMKHGDAKWTVTAANDKWGLKLAAPLLSGDWSVDGCAEVEDKVGTERKVAVSAEIESPDMNGTKAKANASYTATFKNEAREDKVKFDCAFSLPQDVIVGVDVEHKNELSGLAFGAAKKDDGNKYWLGYDVCDKVAKAGALFKAKKCSLTHAYQVKQAEGKFMGQDIPISVAAGGKWAMSDKSTLNYMVEFGADAHAQAKFAHKVDKNWTVTAAQSFNCEHAGKKERKAYHLGFDVAYTL